MKKNMIIAIAVAAIVVIAGVFVALNLNSLFPSNGDTDDNDNDGGDTASDAVDSVNKTLTVNFWTDSVSDADKKVTLNVDYPGKGESNYNYSWNRAYQFNISSAPINGYVGNVLFKMFAQKQQEIALNDIVVKTSNNKDVNFTRNYRDGLYSLYYCLSGDVGSYKSNGSADGLRTFTVQFTDTLNYTFVFQAYDLDTGKAISSPVTIYPLNVPITGSLSFQAGVGARDSDVNGSFYAVLVKATNNWNVRYTVNAAYLVLNNGAEEVAANTTAMEFKSQELAVGQEAQFLAKFYISGVHDDFTLQYRDQISGQISTIPLGG